MKTLSTQEICEIHGGLWFVPIFMAAVGGGYKVGSDFAKTRNERDRILGEGVYSGQCPVE